MLARSYLGSLCRSAAESNADLRNPRRFQKSSRALEAHEGASRDCYPRNRLSAEIRAKVSKASFESGIELFVSGIARLLIA